MVGRAAGGPCPPGQCDVLEGVKAFHDGGGLCSAGRTIGECSQKEMVGCGYAAASETLHASMQVGSRKRGLSRGRWRREWLQTGPEG